MSEIARLLLLLLLAGAALTALGAAAVWWMEEERRLRRAMRRVLSGEADAVVIAHGRGRAAGFNFTSGSVAVAWDAGAWCLVYRIDELVGAELIVDGLVTARAFRDEPRRALDEIAGMANEVVLRLVFDDVRHPDFELELWNDDGVARKGGPATAAKAVQEANRWLARAEAILRRHAAWREGPAPVRPPQPPPPPIPPEEQPELFEEPELADAPPWDEPGDDLDEDFDDDRKS
ncbi:hypothetical protein [Phenylobacterium sp.]|uniref:hypothetical protein n=1 Tax=Phenylobacterium sp. TaxID=1871053 RepID=UPI0027372D30|nr:hypothetical protein [Phenylobacterium sp.]MDP3660800.1 hypothetical protein [Phenylobacterium sp.]